MKTKYIIILLTVALTACSDFLDEVPKDELVVDQFFTEPDHAYGAVNSLYRTGAPNMTDGGVYSGVPAMLGVYMSGFFTNEYAGQELHVSNTQQLTLNGKNISAYLEGMWRNLYLGISRANNALKYIPQTPGLSESEANQLTAESKFFRAYAYYYLVRMFGPVPLITDPYESLDDLYLERASLSAIYGQIENDLTQALASGDLSNTSMANNGKRVTSGTVAGLLAEVYLTMSGHPLNADKYQEAADVSRDIISGKYGAYALEQHNELSPGEIDFENSAYNKIRMNDASGIEHLYLKEFDPSISGSNFPRYSYPTSLSQDVLYDITNGGFQPSTQFLDLYDPVEDLRIQEKQFFHTTFEGSGETFLPTPYIWHDDEAIFETATSGKDQAMLTYADVLLIAAEAIVQSSGNVTSEAVDLLALVRGRAYWKTDNADIVSSLTALDAENFVNEVWIERHRELVFEFQNWFDIVRTRKFPVASSPGVVSFVDVVGHVTSQGKAIESKHLLMPLPDSELQRNPSLGTDNNGY